MAWEGSRGAGLQIQLDHVTPEAGFMGFSIPKMQGIADILAPEGVTDGEIVLKKNVFFPNDEDDLEGSELMNDGRIVEVRGIL